MYVVKNKITGKYWKSHSSEVSLQSAKLYKNKQAADDIVRFYDDLELEVLEVDVVIILKNNLKLK